MIFDAHAHIFPEKIAAKAVEGIGNFYSELVMYLDGTAASLIKQGEEYGIGKFLVHSVATTAEQVPSINNFIAEEVRTYPDKFVGFAAMHPDFEGVGAELDRAVSMGLKGVKIHPDFQRFNIDDERAEKIYAEAEKRSLPVLIHMGDTRTEFSKPARLAKVLDKFTELKVIGAHFGGWSEWDDAEAVLGGGKYRTQLWVDCSSSLYALSPERAKELIDSYGADRVFFGTDYPMWTAKDELERFDRIPLTDEEREMILHRNAEEFLGV